MALENLLLPGETVKYQSPGRVRLGSQKYQLITTGKRLILYRRQGIFFKTEEFKADGIPEIQAISYKEEGALSRMGTLKIKAQGRYTTYTGRAATMKTLYDELQQYSIHAKD
ncbi:MAG: hypothetical protein JSW38_09805 [Dehalococcoidia bacterium]|nr:MAG: hypothetical protein JSV02_05575 [Dehalococcoidia bacterium]UCG82477.1 MAG: hypothetical protein JSW38_09805 [Dehalococcoidia bacterium]